MRHFVRTVEEHTIPERPPLKLSAGDVVRVGKQDTEWPAFVFVTSGTGSGWVPARHLSAVKGDAEVVMPYDTTELPTSVGEVLEVIKADNESGWCWCRSTSGREGWVPNRTLGPQTASPTD